MPSASRVTLLITVLALAALGAACAPVPAGDDPIVGPPIVGGPVEPDDGVLHVVPEPGIVNPVPHAWQRIEIAPDGRTITIYYWGGVQDCYGLAGVDVQYKAGLLMVRVFEGQRANLGPDVACIEIAVAKAVTVELEQPLVAPADQG